MAYRPQFGSKHRDYVYSAAKVEAHVAGRGEFPICPHCDRPVTPDQAWDEVHITIPRCFGGKVKTVGHRLCNRRDNNQVVTPAFAKAERVRKRHLGITGPGLTRHAMPCGRRSSRRKTFHDGVQPRLTHAETHQQFLARRYAFLQAPPTNDNDPLAALTDSLMLGDIDESTFAIRAGALGAAIEEISDLIVLARVEQQVRT